MKNTLELVSTASTELKQDAAQRLTIENVELACNHSMSPPGGRQSLAQGQRSGTKWSEAPPWVRVEENSRARFSGRKSPLCELFLSPAKAGSKVSSDCPPRVPLASLATPWAKLCRLLRRLVERSNPNLQVNLSYSLSAILLISSFAT